MSELINFEDIDVKDVVKRIKAGEIFVYPTDRWIPKNVSILNWI